MNRIIQLLADLRSLGFSMVIHLVAVLFFGTVVIIRNTEEVPDFISDHGGALMAEVPAPAAIKPEEAPKPAEPELPSVSGGPAVNPIAVDVVTTTTAGRAVMPSAPMTPPGLKGLGGLQLGSVGKGLGVAGLGEGMAGTGMRLFGTPPRGKSVVIVVDVSGSMLRGAGKSERTYEVLEKEVAGVVDSFDLKTRFNLVVFSRDAVSFRDRLLTATSDEKAAAIRWLKRKSPTVLNDERADAEEKAFHHGTRADLALEAALAMRPDVVFFVSDGEPTGTKPAELLERVLALQQAAPKATTIHTIAYLADGGQKFMRELAERNFGTFREVNPREVNPREVK